MEEREPIGCDQSRNITFMNFQFRNDRSLLIGFILLIQCVTVLYSSISLMGCMCGGGLLLYVFSVVCFCSFVFEGTDLQEQSKNNLAIVTSVIKNAFICIHLPICQRSHATTDSPVCPSTPICEPDLGVKDTTTWVGVFVNPTESKEEATLPLCAHTLSCAHDVFVT